MKKTVLMHPGFVIDTWCPIEQRYMWLEDSLKKNFNLFWLVPPTGSKHSRCRDENSRGREPIYVSHLKSLNAKLIELDITKYNALRNFRLLAQMLKHHKIDAVYAHFSPLRYYLEMAAKWTGVKVVRAEHNLTFHPSRKYKAVKWLFYKYSTDFYAPVSQSVKEHLRKRRLCDDANALVVYSGYDPSIFPEPNKDASARALKNELSLSDESRLLCCVAGIDPSKRQHLLLAMMKSLDKTCHLLLVGGNKNIAYRKEIESLISEYRLGERVHFLGYRPDVYRIMDASEISYLPSAFEGNPNAIIESQFMRVPVISSDIGPNREIVDDGVSGYCIPDNDLSLYVTRSIELLNDPMKRADFGSRGRHKAERLFSKDSFIEQTERALSAALGFTSGRA